MLGVAFVLNINSIKQMLELTTGATFFDPMIYFLTSKEAKQITGSNIPIDGAWISQ